ncbi:hypothetical protein [Rhodococcus sp. NPDC127528]|uniref:hypothetical protein n=1 Tax=unclassified Rhodococcus (in: high G+C Gram-positive bacteria) TaxID=192944 RepID=UPI0036322F02
MFRRTLTAACCAVAALTVALGAAPAAFAAASQTYFSNPTDDPKQQAFCNDQAALANNLVAKGDQTRADQVVSTANMSGCRIYTFQSPQPGK